jgi:hypothetical protein
LDAGPAWVDAGPQLLPEPSLTATWDGGQADLLLAPNTTVSPVSDFRFETSAVLADCRVRILDDDERMVPNHAEFQRGAGTTIDLTLAKPLPSKHCCRFVVDGELSNLIATADHHYYQPLQARFGVWPQPGEASTRKTHRRRQNHHHRRH